MILEPGHPKRKVPVNETFHVQIDDELTKKELKQIEADDQTIQTILLGLPEDIYAVVDSCKTTQEIWLRVQQMMKGSNIGEVDDLRGEQLSKTQDPLALMATSNNPYTFPVLHQDQPSFNQNYKQQPMPNPEDITDPTTAINMALALLAKAFKLNYSTPTNNNQRISLNQHNRQIAQPESEWEWNYTIRPRRKDAAYLQTQLLIAQKEEARIQLQADEFDLMATAADLDEIEEVNANCILMANLLQASTSGTQTDKAPVYDSDGSSEVHNYENFYDNEIFNMFTQEELHTELLEPILEPHQVPQNDNNVILEVSSVEQSGGTIEQHFTNVEEPRVLYDSVYNNLEIEVEKVNMNFEIHFLKEAAKFVRDFKSLAKEADESLTKYKALELEIEHLLRAVIERLQAQLGDLKGKSKDTSCVSDTLNPLSQKLENENVELEFQVLNYAKENAHLKTAYKNLFDSISVTRTQNQTIIDSLQNKLHDTIYESAKLRVQLFDKVSEQKDTTWGTSANTKFAKQSILGKPPSSSKTKLYVVSQISKSTVSPKVDETHALSNPVTSNSIPTPQESKVMKNDKVIILGIFRINPFKPSREEKYVPNKVRASVRTNLITVSQPSVITKKVVNYDSNGLSSTGVDNIKTRRPQPMSNTKNHWVPFASKSSCSKNKDVEVEEHPRNLLLSKNKKHMLSECNNVKLATQNVKSKVVSAMCKQYLISVNHDVCLLNYVNDINSHGKKQKANVSINENQKKQKPKVKKPKKVGSIERLDSPKPSKPRSFLRWSPTGRLFDLKGKIIASSKSESQSDCSKGDNACTSNPLKPTIKRFPNSTFSLAGYPNMFMVRRLGCSKHMTWNLKLLLNFVWKFLGTIRFKNDHIAVILGFGDLQWGNILITGVYFIEGLGHNLFLVGQFCDSDLEVAFRRNACFVRNLVGVDLLSGNRTTILYTINLHEMASASLICLMARASSTKSWLWHQRLSHLNFDTINDLAKNDLVIGLPKFKYHKEHLCPSCEQGKKSKRASHPPKPVPNYRQRSKDEVPEVTKTFLKRITILLQSPVIIISTDNGSKFKNQVLKEYFDSVGISHQVSSVRTSIATACFTQNRFIIHRRFHKTPYELINGRKPDISFLHVFGALCNPKNDCKDIGKLGEKGLDLTYALSTITTQQSTEGELDLLFEAMIDDYIGGQPLAAPRTILAAQQQGNQAPLQLKTVADNVPNAMFDANMFVNPFATPSTSAGFIDADHPSHVYKLKKDLYGLKQSPRAWRFDDDILVVQVYVDDIIFGSTHPRYIQLFSDLMKSRFKMSMMGEMMLFLGLQVNQSPCGIFINQSIYMLEILKKYGMESCDPVGTPIEIKDKLDLDQNRTPVDATKYHSMIGALIYLTSSRPDIDSGFELNGFPDDDYTGCKDTFKSTSGGAQFLGEKLVRWSSKKQDCTALLTTKAEYVSLSACCTQVL
uniref:Retrovirus-related Pol polyprotein from transposon TNT 1-94 n=1 Tax=Tanacetum cinerariifolium TaxID=118510 RepID=A0A6L2JQ45_TANCI|nr:hypothetical protein [Tanacetum cinerariifolium]